MGLTSLRHNSRSTVWQVDGEDLLQDSHWDIVRQSATLEDGHAAMSFPSEAIPKVAVASAEGCAHW